MRWTYDLSASALYIYLRDEDVAETVEMDDGLTVDVSAGGEVVGIEVLSPEVGWDLAAVVTRFELGEDEQASLALLVRSPLLMKTPPPRPDEARVDVEAPGHAAEASSNSQEVVIAA